MRRRALVYWAAGIALLAFFFAIGRLAVGTMHLNIARQAVEKMGTLMWKPRYVYDGRTLEARFDVVAAEACEHAINGPDECRWNIDRLGRQAAQKYKPTWVVPLAGRRFEAAIAALREQGEPGDWRALALAGALEFGRGRGKAAEELLVRAYDHAQRNLELDHLDAAGLHTALGALHLTRGQAAAAEPFLRRAKTILEAAPDADALDQLHVLTHLARAIFAQGFPEEAEPLCAMALALAEEHERVTGQAFLHRPVLEENLRKLRAR